MKGMASTPDYYIPPTEGPHPGTVIAAEAQLSKQKQNTQIHVSIQLDDVNEVIEDYLITDGTAKGAGMSKVKLRGLGVDVTSDAEVADEVVAANMIGRKVIVEVEHENAQRKAEDGTYQNATHFIPETGQTIQLKRARAKGYRMAVVGGAPAPLAPQGQAPQGYAQQPPQQFQQQAPMQPPMQQAPQQQWAPPAQPQWVPPAAPPMAPPQQYQQPAPAQAPQQQWAPPPQPQQPQQYAGGPAGSMQPAPQQYAQPLPQGYAPQGYQQPPQIPGPAPVQFAPPAPPAGVPWATAPQQPAPVEEPAKKGPGRPRKVADAAQG
ncbi:MAG: hypothetical protein WAV09_02940 [Minisyncoccia bacterium]